jgi:hypothetical protein
MAIAVPTAPLPAACAAMAARHPGPPPRHAAVLGRPGQELIERPPKPATGPVAGAGPRQPAPAGPTAAPQPPRAGGHGADGGGVHGRGGARGDEGARRRLLHVVSNQCIAMFHNVIRHSCIIMFTFQVKLVA